MLKYSRVSIEKDKGMMVRMRGDGENDHGGDDESALGTLNSQQIFFHLQSR